jgi:hypothetical protein
MESSLEQRRAEILAKKAKLAELKKQRELRREQGLGRQSMTASPLGEVRQPVHCLHTNNTDLSPRYCHQHRDEVKTSIAEPTSTTSLTTFLETAAQDQHNRAHQPYAQHGRLL